MQKYTGTIDKKEVDGGILFQYFDLVCGCGEKLGRGLTVRPTTGPHAKFVCTVCQRELGEDVNVRTGGNTEV